MARSSRYKVRFRRRREGKTDYKKRLALLKSGLPRMVVRRTNRYIIVQFIGFKPEGDYVIAYASSKELQKYGWPYGGKNTPAAYLTGFLAALRAKRAGVKKAILDIGRFPSTKGSRLYAALKGALDAGIEIPHSPEVLPDKSRISGEHIAAWASTLKDEKEDVYRRQFSQYLSSNAPPENMPDVFDQMLSHIEDVLESNG